MATRAALREAPGDYVVQVNKNERVRRTLRNWNCVPHLQATDTDAAFTLNIVNGELTGIADGLQSKADLIGSGNSDDLTTIIWCDENPASNYMQGAIKVQGSQDDVMRPVAMAMFIFL